MPRFSIHSQREQLKRLTTDLAIVCTSGKTGGGSAFFASLTRRPLIL
jgi:hypothetical protein